MPDQKSKYALADLPAATPEKSVETPAAWKQATAAVIRSGAPWLAMEGGPPGALINGLAELIAQGVESPDWSQKAHPNWSRVLLEGGLGAVPGKAMISAGRAGLSALKGAGIVELGNMGRRYTEKNSVSDVLPRSMGEAAMDLGTSALGAGVGALGGKLSTAPEPKAPPVPPTAAEAAATKAEALLAASEKMPRKEKARLLQDRKNADAVEAEIAKAKDVTATQNRDELAETFHAREEAAAASKKALEEANARDLFDKTVKGRTPSTSVSETTAAPGVNNAGGKGQVKTTFRVAKPKKGGVPAKPPVEPVPSEPVAASPVPEPTIPPEASTMPPEGPAVGGEPVTPSPVVEPPSGAPKASGALSLLRDELVKRGLSPEEVDQLLAAHLPETQPVQTPRPPTYVATPEQNAALDAAGFPAPASGETLPSSALVNPDAPVVPQDALEPDISTKVALPPEVTPEAPLTGSQGPSEPSPSNIPFRSSQNMATDLYRDLLAADKAGELPVVPGVPRGKQPVRLAGRAARGQPGTERRVADEVTDLVGGRRATDTIPVSEPAVPPVEPPPPPKGVTQTNAARTAAASPEARARASATRIANNLKRKGNQTGEAITPAMLHLLLGGGGALTGAAMDPEDPLTGAVVGGGLGLGAAHAGSKLMTPEGIQTAKDFAAKIPNFQRFAYLSGPSNIVANALGGPYGSGTLGSIEQLLAERLGAPKGTKNATGALGEIGNPKKFLENFWGARDRAGEILRNAQDSERAGSGFTSKPIDWSNPKSIGAHAMEVPATLMAAGDEGVRAALIKHGWTEDEARRVTLTSEPLWKFSKAMMNTTRATDPGEAGSVAMALMFPFKRTALNILEQGVERTPFIGFAAQALKKPEMRDAWQHAVAQQGLGAAVWLTAEQLGESTDPDTAKGLRKFVSNLGGQYSLAASAGFAFGQSARSGKSSLPDLLDSMKTSFTQNTPLPTTQVFSDPEKALKDSLESGSVVLPPALNPGILRDRGIPNTIFGAPSIEDILFGRSLSEKP